MSVAVHVESWQQARPHTKLQTSARPASQETDAHGRAVRRRAACDECRTKKLNCAGQRPACSRCEREKLDCVYSVQKQMGRPKKRRCVEDQANGLAARKDSGASRKARNVTHRDVAEKGVALRGEVTGSGMLDDFLTPGGGLQPWLQSTEWAVPSEHAIPGLTPDSASNSPPTINLPTELLSTSYSHLQTHVATDLFSSSHSHTHAGSTRLLLDPHLGQQDHDNVNLPSAILPTCACLSTLYLALNNLQSMDPAFLFPSSLHHLREAVQAASEVLSCPHCPTRFLSAVQNTQLAGTLLVSIAERFSKILGALTQEAERAEHEGETKKFRLADLNTSTSHLHAGGIGCVAAFTIDLCAGEWRTMAKKVVRAEVHGPSDGITCCPYFVGVVEQMESRQECWHGRSMPDDFPKDENGIPMGGSHIPKEDHVCLKLCAYARKLISGYDWS